MKMEMPDSPSADEALKLAERMGVFGEWPRVLCVCSAAINRSPTAAWVLSRPPYNCTAISAGSHAYKALVAVTQPLLNWAQRVVFINQDNYALVRDLGLRVPEEVYVLNIPDSFSYRDPELIKEIRKELTAANFPAFME